MMILCLAIHAPFEAQSDVNPKRFGGGFPGQIWTPKTIEPGTNGSQRLGTIFFI